MIQHRRISRWFVGYMIALLALLIAAMILLMTRSARADNQIPCWKAKALLAYAGTQAEAEKIAKQHGYTKTQIAEVRRRCGI